MNYINSFIIAKEIDISTTPPIPSYYQSCRLKCGIALSFGDKVKLEGALSPRQVLRVLQESPLLQTEKCYLFSCVI